MTLQFGEVNTQDGLRVALAPATGEDADPVRTAIAELPGTFVVPLRTKGYASYLERRAKVIEDAVHDIRTVGEECIHIPEGISASRMDQMAEVEHYTSKLLQVLQEVSVSVDDKLMVAMDEYLRLRHNARIAHITSTGFRQKHNLARAEREHQARVHAFFCVYVLDWHDALNCKFPNFSISRNMLNGYMQNKMHHTRQQSSN